MKKLWFALGLALLTAACAPAQPPVKGVKVGKPYVIEGKTYYPEYDPHYDRTGTASWYGPGFHGGKTANGETFDQHDLTAAHPTLPMPSLVRVTNLETGKSAVVRINDRGPFKDGRLIDLSKASAQELGVTGLSKVRVKYLKQETEEYWAQMGLKQEDISFAKNDPYAPGKESSGATAGFRPEKSAPQVKSSAPVVSVASADLDPKDLKIRPIKPQFRVISDAEAAEKKSPWDSAREETESVSAEGAESVQEPAEEKSAQGDNVQPKVVRLYKKPGDDQPGTVQPKVVRLVSPPESGMHDREQPVKQAAVAKEDSEAETETGSEAEVAEASAPPPPKPSSAAPAAGGGGWFIQAGSFASAENAEKLAGKLSSIAGVDTAPIEKSGKTWHRVRVGPFAGRSEAEGALGKAQQLGATGAWVVKD